MWCEPAQNIMGTDTDGDGVIYDRDSTGSMSGTNSPSDNGGSEDAD